MKVNKITLANIIAKFHNNIGIKKIANAIGYKKILLTKDDVIAFSSNEPIIITSPDSGFFYTTLIKVTDELMMENIKFAAKGELIISGNDIFLLFKNGGGSSFNFFFRNDFSVINKEEFSCSILRTMKKFIDEFDDYYMGYDKRYMEVYSAGGTTWETTTPNLSLLKIFKRFPHYFIEKKVIDLGCGEGRDTIFLSQKGVDVVGIDISVAALQKAKKISLKNKINAKFIESNVLFLNGIPCEHFDTAINMGCLHMIVNQNERLHHIRNVHRILKKGGIFIIDHCQENWGKGFFSLSGDLYSKDSLIVGNRIDRKIRTYAGEKKIPLEVIPYIEKTAEELSIEISSVGFTLKDTLLTDTEAFGNSALMLFEK